MRICDEDPFDIEDVGSPYAGLTVYRVRFGRTFIPERGAPPDACGPKAGRPKFHTAVGRAVVLEPDHFDLRVYPFYELIHRSWMAGTRNFVRFAPSINLGTSLQEFVFNGGGPELRDLKGERKGCVEDELDRCIFACNTLQTNFVRGNGFVVCPPIPGGNDKSAQLICKPPDAPGMLDDHYEYLGPTEIAGKDGTVTGFDGKYHTLILQHAEGGPIVGSFRVGDNKWADSPSPDLAVCSPRVLRDGKPLSASDIPYCDKSKRQTVGNEVNWDPEKTCTSFTGLGVTAEGSIVVASMFEGSHRADSERGRGILATEMGWLMKRLGAQDGVIGGGSGDTQQFLEADCGDMPRLMLAPSRSKKPEEVALGEVEGPRGLGAIFAVLQKRG